LRIWLSLFFFLFLSLWEYPVDDFLSVKTYHFSCGPVFRFSLPQAAAAAALFTPRFFFATPFLFPIPSVKNNSRIAPVSTHASSPKMANRKTHSSYDFRW